MAGTSSLGRVRQDIDIVARAGLDTATFVEELDASLRRAVPYAAACVATVDPATNLLTSTYKFGDLAGNDQHDQEWALLEYGDDDPTSFLSLIGSDDPACGVCHGTGGDVRRSPRMRDFMLPRFGYVDELRMVARHGSRGWGGIALFRASGERAFDPTEIEFLASLSSTVATGLRAGLLARVAAVEPPTPRSGRPW